jgi:hypothetical protein
MKGTRLKMLAAGLGLMLGALTPVQAQSWGDIGNSLLKGLGGTTGDAGKSTATTGLSQADVVAGLKEALTKGSEIVVEDLGRPDGFLGNPEVRIPLPSTLQSVGQGMRSFGLGSYVDSFETSLNRAAEKAVPEALDLLLATVRRMSIDDAMGILNGPDDAATTFFRERNQSRLSERFLPLVREATASVGVTQTYKSMLAQAGPAAQFFDPASVDIDRYVTDQAVDGLFLLLAEEEKRIREDPLARSSELLQRVFGSR